jgi:glycosyltransferase involved in cell wall biosynthesis
VRVLHIVKGLEYGGLERTLVDILKSFDQDRFELHVVCLHLLGHFAKELNGIAQVHLAPPMGRIAMIWPSALTRLIADIAPDISHSHSGVLYKASLAARRAGIKHVVHTEHGRENPDKISDRLTDGVAARRTDVVVAISKQLAEALPGKIHIDPTKVMYIPNGIDTTVFKPQRDTGALRAELGLGPETRIIGSIGRLEPVKGYEIMIDAFALFLEMDPASDTTLVICGDGSCRSALEQRARDKGIGDRVHLLGWRDDINALHASFTIFTMSSYSEGTSISLLEAMSDGLPPVVTDVGGNAAVLGTELAHRLAPPADPHALASHWHNLLADCTALENERSLARQRVVANFSLERTVRAYTELYERLLARESTSSARKETRG